MCTPEGAIRYMIYPPLPEAQFPREKRGEMQTVRAQQPSQLRPSAFGGAVWATDWLCQPPPGNLTGDIGGGHVLIHMETAWALEGEPVDANDGERACTGRAAVFF